MTTRTETKPKKPRKAAEKKTAAPDECTLVMLTGEQLRIRDLEQELAAEREKCTTALANVAELSALLRKVTAERLDDARRAVGMAEATDAAVQKVLAPSKPTPQEGKPKPPPITVGVGGIEPEPIVLNAASAGIDWRAICMLPPFQIFAQEVMKATHETGIVIEDYAKFAMEFIQHAAQNVSEQELLDNYCAWHAASGKWPKETPFGKEKV